jgi:hypothetical protein
LQAVINQGGSGFNANLGTLCPPQECQGPNNHLWRKKLNLLTTKRLKKMGLMCCVGVLFQLFIIMPNSCMPVSHRETSFIPTTCYFEPLCCM